MATTTAKNPNAAQISRVLNKARLTKRANGERSGYVVKTEKDSGKVINHTTGMPDSFRFPIVHIKWEDATSVALFRSLFHPGDELVVAEKALKAAGYHIERLNVRGVPTLIAMPQALLDWRAERKDRAERAAQIAEEMIPACEKVICHTADTIAHHRVTRILTRDRVIADLTKALRNATVDVLDDEQADRESRWYGEVPADGHTIGLRQGHVLLLMRAA